MTLRNQIMNLNNFFLKIKIKYTCYSKRDIINLKTITFRAQAYGPISWETLRDDNGISRGIMSSPSKSFLF